MIKSNGKQKAMAPGVAIQTALVKMLDGNAQKLEIYLMIVLKFTETES